MTGDELVAFRKKAGLKAKQLADLLEISDATVSRYERGHRPIPKSIEYAVHWLCRETNMSPGDKIVEALKEALEYGRGLRNPGAVRDDGDGSL